MGDLHSIAYNNNTTLHSCSSSLANWDFNTDMSSFVESYTTTPPFLSTFDSDLSSGYLQDALFKFSSKRRRLLLFDDDNQITTTKDSNNYNLWNPISNQSFEENYASMNQITMCDSFSGEPMSRSVSRMSEENSIFTEVKTADEEAISASHETYDSSASSHHKSSVETQCHSAISIAGVSNEKLKKRMIGKVVCPFALVKPGGQEGDVTLNDINERILMRPTRPVRHPVGDFASRPLVSPAGPGLSGKDVVAFTRIHTHGKGTITIIRTRG